MGRGWLDMALPGTPRVSSQHGIEGLQFGNDCTLAVPLQEAQPAWLSTVPGNGWR